MQYIGEGNQKQILLKWRGGRIGLLTIGRNEWLPFHLTLTSDRKVFQVTVDIDEIYMGMLKKVLSRFTCLTDELPLFPGDSGS